MTLFTSGNEHNLSDREFNAIRSILYREASISLSDAKRSLVRSRLAKRLRTLQLSSHTQYLQYLKEQDTDGSELQQMVNCLTTNKTDFFRESHHFDFLRDVVFPEVRRRAQQGAPRELRIWSAACSMGDEPYTIAMTVLDHFGCLDQWHVEIVATDINTEVLQIAERAVYPKEKFQMLSEIRKRKYLLRGTGALADRYQIRPELRRLVKFQQLNLLQQPLHVRGMFDVIFCRNVIIYFDAETQQRLLPQFAGKLRQGGHLMLGHSENVPWLTDRFTSLGNTIYRLNDSASSPLLVTKPKPKETRNSQAEPARPKTNVCHRPAIGQAVRPALRPTLAKTTSQSLVAGQMFASADSICVSTVLGSCVSACLYDPVARIGGMNHFMLPIQDRKEDASGRYGVHAMELLINRIMDLGGDRRRLQAKIFGGARILICEQFGPGIGDSNVQFVRHFLETERIPIVAEKTAGTTALRVHLITDTGQVFAKTIERVTQVVATERRLLNNTKRQLKDQSNITLFERL